MRGQAARLRCCAGARRRCGAPPLADRPRGVTARTGARHADRRTQLSWALCRHPANVSAVLRGAATQALVHGASRVPGLKRVPMLKMLAIAEIALAARAHAVRLTADERRRLVALVRTGRGRPSRLTEAERAELRELVAKAEPRLSAGTVAGALSPAPLPRRVVHGPRRKKG